MTKREQKLIDALGRAQELFGRIEGDYLNDRAPERAESVVTSAREGFRVCVDALSAYPTFPATPANRKDG